MDIATERAFDQLSPTAAQIVLEQLPERIRTAFIARDTELDYLVKSIIEMALAEYLDSEAIWFADCKPNRGKQAA